jgi:hypothetical protein
MNIYQLRTLLQIDDQHRAEAIAKWRRWRAEQKKPAGDLKAS